MRQRAGTGDLVIGVVGPLDLVNRVVLSARHGGTYGQPVRLVSVAYREEGEAVADIERVQDDLDALLFTGPLPYDLARESGRLLVPATYISLAGDAFFAALLRGVLDHACDPNRISVDTVSADDVGDAYADIGSAVSVAGVHVHPYRGPEPSADLAAFHQRLYAAGETTAAVTCVHSVHRRLLDAGMPALRVLPSSTATRIALRAAVLMGRGTRLEESQIAIGIVAVPELRQASGGVPHQWGHELRLATHRLLIRESRRMGATVLPLDGESFIVVATLGSVAAATNDLREPPFVERLRAELGVTAHVGVGLGRTAEDAEASARVAVERAASSPGDFVVGWTGTARRLEHAASAAERAAGPDAGHGAAIYRRLLAALPLDEQDGGGPVVLDAQRVARLLGVPERSARRLLRTIAADGLAWPLPVGLEARPGRPRQRYRLLVGSADDAELTAPPRARPPGGGGARRTGDDASTVDASGPAGAGEAADVSAVDAFQMGNATDVGPS